MDLVGSSVFCSGSCSRSKLLIFVSTQGRRGSELVSVSQENLYGNFLANFSCVLALLFFPWRDFLGAFGSITEGGYSEVHPSAGAGGNKAPSSEPPRWSGG